MNIYIETYGCSVNKNDSEIMGGLLEKAGFIIVHKPKNADIIIINTCAVKETTENKIFHRIKELEKLNKRMIIAGCIPEAEYEKIRSITKSSMIGTGAVTNIVNIVKRVLKGELVEDFSNYKEKICQPKHYFSSVVNILQISEGCLSECAFCITKKARGLLHSYPIETIIEEIEKAKNFGFKEFWLTSQDCGCYGFDIGKNIVDLISGIIEHVSGNYFLRIGMMNPLHIKKITDELVEVFKNQNVFKFAHIPVQSGSDRVLKLMRRGYKVNDFIEIVSELRAEIPEITLWTDIIVGFPGETEEDFYRSLDLIREINPDFVNVSRFSNRPGIVARRMKQIPTNIKKERSRLLSQTVTEHARRRNEKWIGWCGKVLIDEYNPKKRTWVGRNYAYKPVILKGEYKLGRFVSVKINSALNTGLLGVELNKKA